MTFNRSAILFYVATLATVLLSVANVLPQSWLPFIIVLAKVADAFTPRAARRRPRTTPPQAGRGQSGRVSLATLLALLALCPSLLLCTGCPKQKEGETREQFVERIAREGAEGLGNASGDIKAIGQMTRSLRDGGLLDADAARTIESGLLDANSALAAATADALTYESAAEFVGAGSVEHVRRARDVIADLHKRGALHIKNPQRKAEFEVLLTATDFVLNRLEDKFDARPSDGEPLPATPLDAELRRRLERARDQYDANDKSLREDLARPAAPEGASLT